MTDVKQRWSLAEPQPLLTRGLVEQLRLSPTVAQCLVNRGHHDPAKAAQFLQPRLRNLSDPFLLPDMEGAVERIFHAREHGEAVTVFGDYDVDGVTSVTILLEVFQHLGVRAAAYLPHRMDEGYGLTRDAVETCLQRHPARLLLAVDCGSTAVEVIAELRASAVEVIVLDHHQVSEPRPAALALVNPQVSRPDALPHDGGDGRNGIRDPNESRSFLELCSAGLAFKLAHALIKRGRERGLAPALEFDVRGLLDLVALGTVADLVPLVGENRILVTAGLARLGNTPRPGLQALKEVAGVSGAVGVYEVGFQLGPRLNAAGRLENAQRALQLLTAGSLDEALPIARELDARNRERQRIEKTMVDEVCADLRNRFVPEEHFVIVEGRLLWHVGVVGIVASRVMREFYRPTLIIGGEGEEWRGSGRSIEGFDLAGALHECGDLLARHGGHAMAAGISIHPDNIDALRARLNECARRALRGEQLLPVLRLDAEVTFSELDLGFVEQLLQLSPFGQGNPPVQLCSCGLREARPPQPLGKTGQHRKHWVTDGRVTLEAVWWNCADEPPFQGRFDLAYVPQINEFNGRKTIQLKVLDWRPHTESSLKR